MFDWPHAQGNNLGLILSLGLKPFDNTSLTASIPLSSTVQQGTTITGKGHCTIVVRGNGHALVNMQYIVDGGAAVTISAASIEAGVTISFAVSLVIQAVNTDAGGAHPSSDISWTGTYQ